MKPSPRPWPQLTWLGRLSLVSLIVLCAVFFGSLLQGCDNDTKSSTQREEATLTEQNQQRLIKAVPNPQFDTSLERQNLVKRLTTWNVANKISYIYLISFGKVISYHVVKGKVSSVNSLLTTPQQIVKDPIKASVGSYEGVVVTSPDLDGSYGDNPAGGIFFFDVSGNYIEWRGDYLWSDYPLALKNEPELTMAVKDKNAR